VKSPMFLWRALATDLGSELSVDTTRDIKTFASRYGDEGESFFGITLPKLRKEFERALDLGFWDSRAATSFGHYKSLPRFLGGFFELVFVRETGVILDDPSIDAIRAIRQLTGLYGSYPPEIKDGITNAGVSSKRLLQAYSDFVKTDAIVGQSADALDETLLSEFRKTLDAIFGRVLRDVDLAVMRGTLVPRHTSGATADNLKGNAKYRFPEWSDRLEEVFPFLDWTTVNHRFVVDRLADDGSGLSASFRDQGSEIPVKVLAVPKTCEKPRIISEEPSYVQFMQKGLGTAIMDGFKADPIVSDMVRLHDRTLNQARACEGSKTGTLATLDLSEASDRLSNRLVQEGFKWYGHLVKALDATRSRRARIAGTELIFDLNKFASMGSGLTFPMQTMVFTTIAVMGVRKAYSSSLHDAIKASRKKVCVFGDDIIIPVDTVASVIGLLEAFGFKLNTTKSFWTGKFRESCGGDFYNGHDVSYVKVKNRFPDDKPSAESLVHLVALRNRLYERGLWSVVKRFDTWIEDLLGLYPTVSEQSDILGRVTYLQPEGLPLHEDLQTPTVRGYRAIPKHRASPIEGHDALLKWFAEADQEYDELSYLDKPIGDPKRFTHGGRPTSVTLKRGLGLF